MNDLVGRNAILTGGSYGLGPTLARALAREGVNVALVARSAERLEQVAQGLLEVGVRAVAVPADLSDPAAPAAVAAQAAAALGPVDILINSASQHWGGRLHTRTPEQIEQVITTNLAAAIGLTRLVLPGMLQRRQGHVVHIASLAGKAGIPYLSPYVATKYALVGFNHSLQAELRGTGVFSSAICQGFAAEAGMWARLNRKVHPAFGLSTPERVAAAVVRALRRRPVELVVNPMPVHPVILLWAVAPGLAAQVFRWLRINAFMQGVAQQLEADDSPAQPAGASQAAARPLTEAPAG